MKTLGDVLGIYFLLAGIVFVLFLAVGAIRWLREALGGEEIEP